MLVLGNMNIHSVPEQTRAGAHLGACGVHSDAGTDKRRPYFVIICISKVTLSFIALVTLVVALCLPQKNEKIPQRNPDEPSDTKYKQNGNVTQITSRMKSWGPDLYTTKVSSEV